MVKKRVGWHPDEDLDPEHEHWMAIKAARHMLKKGASLKDVCDMYHVTPEEVKESK